MVFFTTPELLEIGGMPLVSERDKPTRNEALKVLPESRECLQPQRESVRGRCRQHREDRRDAFPVSRPSLEGFTKRRTSSSRSATTTTRILSASRAKTCPTSRITTRNRILFSIATSSSSAAKIRRPKPRSTCFGVERGCPWFTGARRWDQPSNTGFGPDIENRFKNRRNQAVLQCASARNHARAHVAYLSEGTRARRSGAPGFRVDRISLYTTKFFDQLGVDGFRYTSRRIRSRDF